MASLRIPLAHTVSTTSLVLVPFGHPPPGARHVHLKLARAVGVDEKEEHVEPDDDEDMMMI